MIDLGDVAARAARAVEPRPRSARRVRRLRLGVLVAIVLALVRADTAVAASAPLRFQGYLPIQTPAGLLIADGRALVISKGGQQLTAYALPGGRRLWTTPVHTDVGPAQVGSAQVFTLGSVVIVNPTSRVANGDIEALDLATGREMWLLPAFGAMVVGSTLLAFSVDGTTVPANTHLARIDPESGRTIWTSAQRADCSTSFDNGGGGRGAQLIGFCYTTNQLTVTDLFTGVVRASRHIDLSGVSAVIPLGDSIVVEQDDNATLSLRAYSTKDLGLMWSGLPVTSDAPVQACGDYLCVKSTSDGMWMIDPHNGVRLPAASTPIAGRAPSLGLNVHEDAIVPVGQLVALSDPDAEVPDLSFAVQEATPLGQAVELPVYLAGTPVTWIAEQTFIDGVVGYPPIGELHDVGIGCRYIGPYVACMTAQQRLGLWLIKPLQ